ncbi:MAG TPA: hypothetical protein VFQ78_02555 [Candidatus Udaeobacter sp.]|jgi:hypothetical protein|nr:hypothetical protein [Candidatus Udaeobacter sp.]
MQKPAILFYLFPSALCAEPTLDFSNLNNNSRFVEAATIPAKNHINNRQFTRARPPHQLHDSTRDTALGPVSGSAAHSE